MKKKQETQQKRQQRPNTPPICSRQKLLIAIGKFKSGRKGRGKSLT